MYGPGALVDGPAVGLCLPEVPGLGLCLPEGPGAGVVLAEGPGAAPVLPDGFPVAGAGGGGDANVMTGIIA